MSSDALKRCIADIPHTCPLDEPWCSEWCRLHSLNLAAIAAGDWAAACKFADERYGVYLRYLRTEGL